MTKRIPHSSVARAKAIRLQRAAAEQRAFGNIRVARSLIEMARDWRLIAEGEQWAEEAREICARLDAERRVFVLDNAAFDIAATPSASVLRLTPYNPSVKGSIKKSLQAAMTEFGVLVISYVWPEVRL